MGYVSENIRNIALIGHNGEGKTSLCEAMLFNAGVINRLGTTDGGNTVMDYTPEEIERKMSINASLASFEWDGNKINVIDTPGAFDFNGDLLSAINVVGASIIVASSNRDISVGTERAIEFVEKYNIPSILFISKVEKENHDYNVTLQKYIERYPKKFAVIEIPIIENGLMTGYVDVLDGKAYKTTTWEEIPIPKNLEEAYENYRTILTELAAESDEELLDKYFGGEQLTQEEVVNGIKKRQVDDGIIFVMGGSCTHNKGVKILMDEIVRCMRNPKEVPLRAGVDASGNEVLQAIDSNKPFSALIFKTIYDPYVGKLSYIKVQTGSVKNGDMLFNAETGKTEKVGGIFKMVGKKQIAVDEISAGDIGVIAKLQYAQTGETLCSEDFVVTYQKPEIPEPILTMAVKTDVKDELDKIVNGLSKIAEEDKLFEYKTDAETNELLISGMGDMHLDIIISKVNNRFGTHAKLQARKIPYRETITAVATAQGKHKKQSGGHGQYGDVWVRFEPCEEDYIFAEEIVGGAVPKNYLPAVDKGIREELKRGSLKGYPLVGVKAVCYDGSYHDVDSSEAAFMMAGILAVKEGIPKAKPVLLEPICKMTIRIKTMDLGDILSDISRRRGRVIDIEATGDYQIVNAEAPMATISNYAVDLRAMTKGRGSFTAKFVRYDKLPKEVEI